MNSKTFAVNSANSPNEPLLTNIDIINVQCRKIIERYQNLLGLKTVKVYFAEVSIILDELSEYMSFYFDT